MINYASKRKALNTISGVGNKGRYFTDNLYARHRFVKHMLSYSDNEVHLIGTSKLSVMDTTNLDNRREAIRELSRK